MSIGDGKSTTEVSELRFDVGIPIFLLNAANISLENAIPMQKDGIRGPSKPPDVANWTSHISVLAL